MDREQELKRRFVEAIRNSLPECPLIGPKWFRYEPEAHPPVFRFVAMAKLVKATGMRRDKLVDRLMENLDLRGVKGEAHVSRKGEIYVSLEEASGAEASR